MKSRIEVFVQFDYRGETLRPTVVVDLDLLMRGQGSIPSLYPLLAKENSIGLYSYELEVMESLPIEVSDAQGLAAEFVEAQQFDQQGFEAAWHLEQAREQIEAAAGEILGDDFLQQHPQVMEALQAAYQLGKAVS